MSIIPRPPSSDLRVNTSAISHSIENDGAWSVGCCCYQHLVAYFDDDPMNRPIPYDNDCYKKTKGWEEKYRAHEIWAMGTEKRRVASQERLDARILYQKRQQEELERLQAQNRSLVHSAMEQESRKRRVGLNILRSNHGTTQTPSTGTATLMPKQQIVTHKKLSYQRSIRKQVLRVPMVQTKPSRRQ
jgi:hypothetical protein